MADMDGDKQRQARRGAGRPRRLTLEAIVDAACDVPLDELEMASIARRLNVGAATLYGYIENREQLVNLVTQRKSQLEHIVERGQSWPEILREHARKTYQSMVKWPEIIVQSLNGSFFGAVEAYYLEHLLELMRARGFSTGETLNVYYAVNQLVIGAAVTSTYRRIATEQAEGHGSALQRFVMAQAPAELPLLREALTINPAPEVLDDYSAALERLIAELEQKHQES